MLVEVCSKYFTNVFTPKELFVVSTDGHWHQFNTNGLPVCGAVKQETLFNANRANVIELSWRTGGLQGGLQVRPCPARQPYTLLRFLFHLQLGKHTRGVWGKVLWEPERS